jgi:hypothetical protein
MEHLAGHVRRIVRCQKDKRRRDFLGLPGAFHRRVAAERLHLFARKRGWNQRRSDRARRNGIDPNPLLRQDLRK